LHTLLSIPLSSFALVCSSSFQATVCRTIDNIIQTKETIFRQINFALVMSYMGLTRAAKAKLSGSGTSKQLIQTNPSQIDKQDSDKSSLNLPKFDQCSIIQTTKSFSNGLPLLLLAVARRPHRSIPTPCHRRTRLRLLPPHDAPASQSTRTQPSPAPACLDVVTASTSLACLDTVADNRIASAAASLL
jgi:hypothetical protein